MKYVCDLWLESDCAGSNLSPYGHFMFESEKFPTTEELGCILMKQFPLLQNDYIFDKHVISASPGGRKSKTTPHYVSVFFIINNTKYYLSFTNVRPILEDNTDEINLYT